MLTMNSATALMAPHNTEGCLRIVTATDVELSVSMLTDQVDPKTSAVGGDESEVAAMCTLVSLFR